MTETGHDGGHQVHISEANLRGNEPPRPRRPSPRRRRRAEPGARGGGAAHRRREARGPEDLQRVARVWLRAGQGRGLRGGPRRGPRRGRGRRTRGGARVLRGRDQGGRGVVRLGVHALVADPRGSHALRRARARGHRDRDRGVDRARACPSGSGRGGAAGRAGRGALRACHAGLDRGRARGRAAGARGAADAVRDASARR